MRGPSIPSPKGVHRAPSLKMGRGSFQSLSDMRNQRGSTGSSMAVLARSGSASGSGSECNVQQWITSRTSQGRSLDVKFIADSLSTSLEVAIFDHLRYVWTVLHILRSARLRKCFDSASII